MTDHDRGAYTPQTDAPLSFDARRAPGGGGRPVPMTLMISGMVLVILLIGVVYFYRSGVRQANQAPQVIGAPVGATKAPPPSSEQPSDAAAGLQVYKSEAAPVSEAQGSAGQPAAGAPQAAAPAAPKFTPAPEQPEPRPAPRATPTPAPAPAVAARSAPAKLASTAPALAPAKPAPKAPAVKPAPTASAPAGGAMVQIGAFSSAALADKGWNDTTKVLPGAMAGKTKSVQVVQKDGATFYRTSVAGFASRADAASFCASLKAAGKSCIVK